MTARSGLQQTVAVFFLLFLPTAGHTLTPDQVFDKVKSSIVAIESLDAMGKLKSHGSGVVLPSGKIATNCDVVKGGITYRVGQGNQSVFAALYAVDTDRNICLLDAKDIPAAKPVQLGKAATLKVGAPVYAVGAPQSLEPFQSERKIAQLRGVPAPFIQTTASIFPGSSGGGLFDEEGRLVGLTALYIDGDLRLCFAMPTEWIAEIKPGRRQVENVDQFAWAFGNNKPGRRQLLIIENNNGQPQWLMHAMALEGKKDWKGLLDLTKKWTEKKPKSDLAWNSLGTTYSRLNRSSDAIDAYKQALRINPTDTDIWNNLGISYSKLNRHNDAIDAFRQALRVNPDYTNAWNNLGSIFGTLNRHDDAIDAYRQVLNINPEDAKAWYNIGNTYYKTNRGNDAINAYRQALRINPEYANAWYNLGYAYGELKRHNDAIDAYRQALRINPEHASAWYNLGITYGLLNRTDDAIDAYREALRINPEYANAWYNLGGTYALAGNRSAALSAFRELRRVNPSEADKLFNLIVPK